MAGWSGFTDEELSELKSESNAQLPSKSNKSPAQNAKKNREIRRKGNVALAKTVARPCLPTQPTSSENNGSNGKDNIKSIESKDLKKCEPVEQKIIASNNKVAENVSVENDDQKKQNEERKQSTEDEEEKQELKLLTETDALKIQMSELEKLQKKQKEIEEENKVKRKIIKDTISERYKKAQVEASTLQTVQKDLSHLDHLLANDVEILRHKIEEATVAYSQAQKRYDKAEREFVNAKFDLQLKSDNKDQLTQHLYTIIQENELRKARKLEELMSKLNMEKTVVQNKSELRNTNTQNTEKTELSKTNDETPT